MLVLLICILGLIILYLHIIELFEKLNLKTLFKYKIKASGIQDSQMQLFCSQ
jgi:hypothetical protein